LPSTLQRLLTRMSMPPNSCTARSTTAQQCPASKRSPGDQHAPGRYPGARRPIPLWELIQM
jgi:hypothetical protein